MAQKSLTRILAELKVMDSKLTTSIHAIKIAGVVIGAENTPVSKEYKSKEDMLSKFNASLNSAKDLINERIMLKRALIKANHETTVVIGTNTITIAEAIDLKAVYSKKLDLLRVCKSSYNTAVHDCNNRQTELDINIDKKITTLMGTSNKSNENSATVDNLKATLKKDFNPTIVAIDNITDYIVSIETEYNDFITNIDYALNEKNAITMVEV